MSGTRHFWTAKGLLVVLLSLGFFLPAKALSAEKGDSLQHYKMLSSVEYTGKTQFRHQIETLVTVRKQILPEGKVKYFVSADNLGLGSGEPGSHERPAFNGLSFVVDRAKGLLSGGDRHLGLLEKINNECVPALTRLPQEHVGKTWKQSFHLAAVDPVLPEELRLTLTATALSTKRFGTLIGVRALSEPFVVKMADAPKDAGTLTARINVAYLFDAKLEEIYLSLSVFHAHTTMNGGNEILRHEVATYKTDATGASIDLGGLGTKFAAFAREVGLTNKGWTVKEQAPLPGWAQSEGLMAAEAASVCAAVACEGAPNPVAMIYVPLTRTIAMQSRGVITPMPSFGTVGNALTTRVTGLGGVKVAVAPAGAGLGLGPAAVGGGAAAAAGLAIAEASDDDDDSRSPSVP